MLNDPCETEYGKHKEYQAFQSVPEPRAETAEHDGGQQSDEDGEQE